MFMYVVYLALTLLLSTTPIESTIDKALKKASYKHIHTSEHIALQYNKDESYLL